MKFYERILLDLKSEEHSFQTVYRHAFSFGNNIAFEQSRNLVIERISYEQCRQEVLRLTGVLREHIAPGRVVALVMPNSPLWVECFWAIFQSGCRALLLSAMMPPSVLDRCLREAGAELVLGDSATEVCPSLSCDFLKTAKAAAPLTAEPETGWGDEVILATSSTTGAPKLYSFDGRAICCQILNSESLLKRFREVAHFRHGVIRQLAFLPFSHVFGLTACFLWFTMFGITFVFLNDMRPETILRTCRLHCVTHVFAVPLLWDTLASQVMREAENQGRAETLKKAMALSLKLQNLHPGLGRLFAALAFRTVHRQALGPGISCCISGGGMLRDDTLPIVNALGYPLENGYGMTEIGIACLAIRTKPGRRRGLSVGRPFPSLTFRLDENDQLLVKGDSCYTARYIDGKRVENEPGSWFSTGDLFETDASGDYRFRGRMDDLVNGANGERLSPDLIESQLNLEAPCCVFGLPDGTLALTAALSAEVTAVPNRLRSAVDEIYRAIAALPMAMQPRTVYIARQPLPLSLSGKIRRRALKAGILDGSFPVDTASALLDSASGSSEAALRLIDGLREIFSEVTRTDREVSADSHFFDDLGGDSLSYLELISAIETRWNLPLAGENPSLITPRAAAEYVARRLESSVKSTTKDGC